MIDREIVRLQKRLDVLEQREPPLAAEFVSSASSPADDLLVVVDGWDNGEHTFGPVRWSPIGGALPQDGDEAVIVERDDGVWQVVAWWSASQGTGVAQSAVDALDTRIDALEAAPESAVAPSLTGSWVNFGAPYASVGYYRHQGRVYLTGAVKTGTSGTSAFTLPTGYRPTGTLERPIIASGGVAEVVIATDGTVKPTNIGATAVATAAVLDGTSFRHA